jgi:hypothetical protein
VAQRIVERLEYMLPGILRDRRKRAVTPPRNISARSAADAGTNAPSGNIRRMPADISGAAAEQRIPGGVEPAATALTSVQIPFIPAVDNMNKWAILPS